MKRAFLSAALLVLPVPAVAQQPALPPEVQEVLQDWTAESRARDHTGASLQKLLVTYQKAEAERARLAAEVEGWKVYAKPLYEFNVSGR